MNVALGVLQIVLALAFLMAGLLKSTQPKEKLVTNMAWAEDFSPGTLKTIGVLEILAALGLVLPGLTGIATVLTPLAATGLAIVMVGAIVVHARRHETQGVIINVVLLLLSALIAWARFGPYHY
ncbi:DoxX family protein [Sphaerisporangium corydalis]|uniref:DoxX family protein n=1 Tax=Sphaerisporangium corydalis TaxID=1441875 RepID=A0ABV9EAJ0_9ACTN|nr:DoxX family protein [Sphaerisporangium corydalis]